MEDLEVKGVPEIVMALFPTFLSDTAAGSGLLLTFYPNKFLNKLRHILVINMR